MSVEEVIQNFKDGVADGLLHGERDEKKSHHYYNQGYDFGVYLYGELKIEENSEWKDWFIIHGIPSWTMNTIPWDIYLT